MYLLLVAISMICVIEIPVVLVWALLRWRNGQPKFERPLWRSCAGLAAFCLAGLSAGLYLGLFLRALVRPFPFYDPFLLRCYGIGLILGLVGLVISLVGKGKLRWPAALVSASMALLWFVTALGE